MWQIKQNLYDLSEQGVPAEFQPFSAMFFFFFFQTEVEVNSEMAHVYEHTHTEKVKFQFCSQFQRSFKLFREHTFTHGTRESCG